MSGAVAAHQNNRAPVPFQNNPYGQSLYKEQVPYGLEYANAYELGMGGPDPGQYLQDPQVYAAMEAEREAYNLATAQAQAEAAYEQYCEEHPEADPVRSVWVAGETAYAIEKATKLAAQTAQLKQEQEVAKATLAELEEAHEAASAEMSRAARDAQVASYELAVARAEVQKAQETVWGVEAEADKFDDSYRKMQKHAQEHAVRHGLRRGVHKWLDSAVAAAGELQQRCLDKKAEAAMHKTILKARIEESQIAAELWKELDNEYYELQKVANNAADHWFVASQCTVLYD